MQQTVPHEDEHIRPAGVDDATVNAVGKLSEALEKLERARGALYDFHQLVGGADNTLGEAVQLLAQAGHNKQATALRQELVGRNVLPGRWTFQMVEEFDDGYYATFKRLESQVRNALVQGKRHIFESELKEQNRTPRLPGHEARP